MIFLSRSVWTSRGTNGTRNKLTNIRYCDDSCVWAENVRPFKPLTNITSAFPIKINMKTLLNKWVIEIKKFLTRKIFYRRISVLLSLCDYFYFLRTEYLKLRLALLPLAQRNPAAGDHFILIHYVYFPTAFFFFAFEFYVSPSRVLNILTKIFVLWQS